jgi:hypothetical protein
VTGRRVRRLILLALIAGVGYWIYKDRPTPGGLIDSLTNPLMGSKAAVESSERNRVVGEASTALSEQTDASVGALHEGMGTSEVREILGDPSSIEEETVAGVHRSRWTYKRLHRVLVFQDGKIVSIAIK